MRHEAEHSQLSLHHLACVLCKEGAAPWRRVRWDTLQYKGALAYGQGASIGSCTLLPGQPLVVSDPTLAVLYEYKWLYVGSITNTCTVHTFKYSACKR